MRSWIRKRTSRLRSAPLGGGDVADPRWLRPSGRARSPADRHSRRARRVLRARPPADYSTGRTSRTRRTRRGSPRKWRATTLLGGWRESPKLPDLVRTTCAPPIATAAKAPSCGTGSCSTRTSLRRVSLAVDQWRLGLRLVACSALRTVGRAVVLSGCLLAGRYPLGVLLRDQSFDAVGEQRARFGCLPVGAGVGEEEVLLVLE